MRAEDGLLRARHGREDLREEFPHLVGRAVAHRVRQIDRRRARGDDLLDHLTQELEVAARRILRRELHIVGEIARARDRRDGALEALIARDAKLGLKVQIGSGEEEVNAGARGGLERAAGAIDVARGAARQRRDDRPPALPAATSRTDSASASDAIGNPASMISTPSSSSWRASRNFSSTRIEKPGACSPSRRVVSKTTTVVSDMEVSSSPLARVARQRTGESGTSE